MMASAEALAQDRGRCVRRAVRADERVDAGVGLQPQGEREPGDGQHGDEHEHERGPADSQRRGSVQRACAV